jgi:hypothetical protein
MPSTVTRRDLALALSATAALAAQAPPATPPLPQNPDEELLAVRAQVRQTSALLTKFDVPQATEPASRFQA